METEVVKIKVMVREIKMVMEETEAEKQMETVVPISSLKRKLKLLKTKKLSLNPLRN
jgi:hypothetical protein